MTEFGHSEYDENFGVPGDPGLPYSEDTGPEFSFAPEDSNNGEVEAELPEALHGLGAGGDNPMAAETSIPRPHEVPMGENASAPSANDIDLPSDIIDKLDGDLYDAGMSGAETHKYYVADHPNLLVRLNPETTVEIAQEAKASADRMVPNGVNVLPSTIVPHDGEVYVITQLVDGRDLRQALIDDPSDELLNEVDQTMAGLCNGFAGCQRNGQELPFDITSLCQYMYGRLYGEDASASKIWLVDLPQASMKLAPDNDHYAHEIMEVANTIVEVEELTGRPLDNARQTIEQALTLCTDSTRYGDGLVQATRHVLANGGRIAMWDDDDIIHTLRTR